MLFTGVFRWIRGETPRDGASFDWDVLNIEWSWRFVFRWVNGVENVDESMDGYVWDVGEADCGTDGDEWAEEIEDNFGRLKQARRIKCRAFDFDGRIISGLDNSSKKTSKQSNYLVLCLSIRYGRFSRELVSNRHKNKSHLLWLIQLFV